MQKNEAQEEVINTIDGQLIVIACPGSGKTTTLVRRIHHMTADCGIPSEHILMITFTSAAAREMRERYQKMYGKDEVTFCTIHSLCLSILRKFRGLTNENLLTDQQSYFYGALQKIKGINDKDAFIKLLMTDISVLKNNSIDIDEFVPQCCDDKPLFERLYNEYEQYKEEYQLIDFDDMLIQAYDCMRHDRECLSWLQEKYQYIQVDEYQDTNFLQRDIVYLLAGSDGNLAVVGDDDQSIYGFRGARPEVMLRFQDFYPDVKFVRMNTNYRSCSGIIAAADHLIKQNTDRFTKEFQAFHQENGSVEVVSKNTRQIELFAVMTKIKALIESGEDPSNIAVLYRTNQQSEDMAALLLSQKIPFVSTEKIPNRYQHWMFEDIRSYQKLSKGKKWSKQDLVRVLNHPQRFLSNYAYINAGLDEQKMTSAAFKQNPAGWKRDNTISTIHKFFNALRMMNGKAPSAFLRTMATFAEYRKYLDEYAKFRNMDLQELLDIWNKYIEDAQKHDDWVEWERYIIGYNKAIEDAQKNRTGVTLSTMHCSKGLEWKHVFIIDCVEGVTPFEKAQTATAVEEERRLFYVAMTRAKEHLYLCTYSERAKKQVKRSRFLT